MYANSFAPGGWLLPVTLWVLLNCVSLAVGAAAMMSLETRAFVEELMFRSHAVPFFFCFFLFVFVNFFLCFVQYTCVFFNTVYYRLRSLENARFYEPTHVYIPMQYHFVKPPTPPLYETWPGF